MGKFKNSADGRASLVPIVCTMRSDSLAQRRGGAYHCYFGGAGRAGIGVLRAVAVNAAT